MASLMNTAADMLADAMCEAVMTLHSAHATSQPGITDGSTSVPFAITLIESNEGLSDNKFGNAAQCITTNPTIAMVYVSMTDQAACSRYIRKQVDVLHGYEAAT